MPTRNEMRRAGEHARQDVAAELVEPERMRRRRARPAAAPAPAAPGSNGVTSGPDQRGQQRHAHDRRADLQHGSFIADPRIEEAVRDVGQQIHRDVGDGDQQDATLHERDSRER